MKNNTTTINTTTNVTTNQEAKEATTMTNENNILDILEEMLDGRTQEQKVDTYVDTYNLLLAQSLEANDDEREIINSNLSLLISVIEQEATEAQKAVFRKALEEAIQTGDFQNTLTAGKIIANDIVSKKPSLLPILKRALGGLFGFIKKHAHTGFRLLRGGVRVVIDTVKWIVVHTKDLLLGLGRFTIDTLTSIFMAFKDIAIYSGKRFKVAGDEIAESFDRNVKAEAKEFGADLNYAAQNAVANLKVRMA